MDISQVTLCAIDTEPGLAIRAMNICLEQCEFGDAVLITNKQIYAPFRVANVNLQTYAPGWYSIFCVKQLVDYIHTPFVLLVQYDGYVVNPGCWDDEFLKYDYIGAVWPWWAGSDPEGDKIINIVGNGGFSLRSKRLLEATAKLAAPKSDEPEDSYICVTNREKLEASGISFAPLHLARKFAYEREPPQCNTFGFHGFYNMWRHISEPEMIRLIPSMATYVVCRSEFRELMEFYERHGRSEVLVALKNRLSEVELSMAK